MRLTGLLCLVCLSSAGGLSAQQDYDLESAVLPLPPALRSTATIVRYVGGGLQTLRPGSNGFFCVVDDPGDDRFSVECHPEVLRTLVLYRREASRSRSERDRVLTDAVRRGTVPLPSGATSRLISGRLVSGAATPDSVTVWSEIAVPFADSTSVGIGTDRGLPLWLHHVGGWDAHIMVDYRTIAWAELSTER